MPGYYKVELLLLLLFSCISGNIIAQENDLRIQLKEFDITFSGTSSFSKSQIEIITKTGKNDFFDISELNDDIIKIKKFYFDNGYFDAEVDTSININQKSKKAYVIIIINEKTPYRINKINLSGVENISSNINRLLNNPIDAIIKQGDIYNRSNVTLEVFRLINVLNNNGYADAVFEPPEVTKIISTNPKSSKSVNINVSLRPGAQYRINKITFDVSKNEHNIISHDFYRDLEIHDNEIFSKEKIVLSENKLSRNSIVEYARIQIKGVDSNENKLDLVVNINLRNKYEIKPQIFGYDINNRFYAGVGLAFSDWYFFGGGRSQTVDARILYHSIDINALELNFQLNQPYIFNNYKINGNWELKATLNSDEVFQISTIKNTFQIVYELPNYTYINNLGFEWKLSNERFTVRNSVDSANSLSNDFLTNVFSSVFGVTVSHNSLNDIQFPSKGNIQIFSAEESGALSNLLKQIFTLSSISYVKFTSVSKLFFNLGDFKARSVLGIKFLAGAIFEYGDNKIEFDNKTYGLNIVPLEFKYIAGGSTSVRGWGAKKLGTFQGKENGGNFLIEGTFEHRIRPFLDAKSIFKDLGFVTFFDYGNLWETPKLFRFDQVALAIGFGIRYYTIVGPVRFDVGFKLYDYDPGAGIDKWLFSNNITTIFKNQLSFQFGIGNTF